MSCTRSSGPDLASKIKLNMRIFIIKLFLVFIFALIKLLPKKLIKQMAHPCSGLAEGIGTVLAPSPTSLKGPLRAL